MNISKLFAFFKFRFDLGSVFLAFANFAMLVIMFSEKIVTFFNLTMPKAQMWVSLIAIPCGFIFILILGEVMVRAQYFQHYVTETNDRNPILNEILNEVKKSNKEK